MFHNYSYDFGVGLLVTVCIAFFLASYAAIFLTKREQHNTTRTARLAAETGVVGGLWFWLLARFIMAGGPANAYVFQRGLLTGLMVIDLLWVILMWPFIAWRTGRELGTPFWRLDETVGYTGLAAMIACSLTYISWEAMRLI